MSLEPGVRLGVHEIVSLLGAGGMGEVYLAHDTKLNRRVAIKVLPSAYASDADRIARFHREAQAVAALNHSAIASIYDLAEDNGTKFLVLELIEGDTLADRLRGGALPVDDALRIAQQILEALEAAHERGVCHRDLKPANIKLTRDGGVKVLDFGLAKFLQNAPSSPQMSHSPTLSLAGTYPGLILGTAGYMSPEQARGHDADQRSDIFAFGCILYELLTGRQAFEGASASDILAAVLKSDVDWSALPPRLNPRLIDLLKRCLEKDPRKRWHAAADVRVELEAIRERAIVTEQQPLAAAMRAPLWKRIVFATALVIVTAAIAAYTTWRLKPEPTSNVTRFSVQLREGQQITSVNRQTLALSPDGRNLVYVADNQLHLRPLASLEARPIAGAQAAGGVFSPAFSPNGEWLAFRESTGTIKRIAIAGGSTLPVCTADSLVSALSWYEDSILFAQAAKGIMRVSADGGVPEVIAPIAADEFADAPRMLPGGRVVLFSVKKQADTIDKYDIVAQTVGGERKVVLVGGADAHYLPTGHLVYAVSGVIMAVPFDLERLTVTGGPVPVVEGVRRGGGSGNLVAATAHLAISNSGGIVYLPGPVTLGSERDNDLAIFDHNDTPKPLGLARGSYLAPRAALDGKWIAFETSDERAAFISLYEIGGNRPARRLTFNGNSRAPVWSPDGQWIAFQSDHEGDEATYRIRADGSGTPERLTRPEKGRSHIPQSWSADGLRLLFADSGGDITTSSLWVYAFADRKATRYGDVGVREATFSPDGRWIAYGARTPNPAANPNRVFVAPYPATQAKYELPIVGGHPVWTRKGDALLINSSPTESFFVPVRTVPSFAFGQPQPFPRQRRIEANPVTNRRQVDVLPDGRVVGVLSSTAVAAIESSQIIVVTNWFDEIRQRVRSR